ncbi:Proliferation-associated protein 2G4 [Trichinella pseudospiralis]|uniref:Proliferation-associated protein 2G4 n=1 Tax=Trichinella pseudospiralis TaxID=6337 RepID=A0A0V1E6B6_TRIPS|nr:Proliferation-associated protein 2G4 [Trichinella pseudospiralis]
MSSHGEKDKNTEEDPLEDTIARDSVVTKYSAAGNIADEVLKELIAKCEENQSVRELCEFGDKSITERAAKVFKKKNVKKGIAFPTCISVNHCIFNFSPLKSEPDVVLAAGDVVKIELGVHVDGFIAMVAHTVVVNVDKEEKIMGRRADVILAAYYCLEAAVRMLRPGVYKNTDLIDIIDKVAAVYNCHGPNEIIQHPTEKKPVEFQKHEFEDHEVYALGVVISTGDGKPKSNEVRTTVYKRNEDVIYQLKMKASRAFFFDCERQFGSMGFTLRNFEDEKKARLGVIECEKHNLLKPYQVLYEREGEFVAYFKTTVLVLPSGLVKVCGLGIPLDRYESEFEIQDKELLQLINSSLKHSKKKSKKSESESGPPPAGNAIQA